MCQIAPNSRDERNIFCSFPGQQFWNKMGHSFKREPSFSLVVPCCRCHLAPPGKSSFAADLPPFHRVFGWAKSQANWGEGKKFAQLQKYGKEESLFLFCSSRETPCSLWLLAAAWCCCLSRCGGNFAVTAAAGGGGREGRVPPQNQSLNCRSRAIKLHVELSGEAARSSQI